MESKDPILRFSQFEHLFEELFHSAPEGILLVDRKGKILLVNPRCHEIFGYKPDELTGLPVETLVPEEFAIKHQSHNRRYFQDPESNAMAAGRELPARKKSGEIFPVEISLSPVRTKDGILVTAFISDITERKRVENELSARAAFENLILRLSTSFIDAGSDQVDELICFVLSEIARFSGTDRSYVTMIHTEDSTASTTHEWCGTGIPKLKDRLQSFKIDPFQEVWAKLARNEAIMIPDVSALPAGQEADRNFLLEMGVKSVLMVPMMIRGELIGTIGFDNFQKKQEWDEYQVALIRIVGDMVSKLLERRMMESRQLNAVIEGQERERKRIAGELHDSLGVLLSTVKANLGALETELQCIKPEKQAYYKNAISLLDNAMTEIRGLVSDLLPRLLENYGLVVALEYLCDKIEAGNEVDLDFYSMNMEDRLPQSVEINLYRIAQELLNNVIKYANATQITVQLIRHRESVVLMVEDDGVGFDLSSIRFHQGFGLRSIESRAKLINSSFVIDSHPHKGTVATVEVPLTEKPHG